MEPKSELEGLAMILLGHLRSMSRSLRKLSEEQWDWTYAPPAPTPRILAVHALQWLQCDRQHIRNPDVSTHKFIPEPPLVPELICDAIEREADEWEALLQSLTADDLNRPGLQFGNPEGHFNVRGFVVHMVQNVIYKHGEFATIFFALGLDGTEPYDAPFPNRIYEQQCGITQ